MTPASHFLTLADLSRDTLQQLLRLTAAVKREPQRFKHALEGKQLTLLFEKPSTRTRLSFEVGIRQLGGGSLSFDADQLQLQRGESIADTARVMSRYVDALVARVFSHDTMRELAKHATIPVINGLDDIYHPCQGLSDAFTLQELFGEKLDGLPFAYIGDGNNVCHSLIFVAAKLGMHLRVATPPGYEPNPAIVERSQSDFKETGGSLMITNDPVEASKEARALYTDVWTSMGQEKENEKRRRDFASYQINDALFAHAAPDAKFLHCLPAHRDEEVSASVADGPRSVIFDQAENRLHGQKAILLWLLQDGKDVAGLESMV